MEHDIHKIGGILIKDGKLLVSRSKGKDIFVAPGGKVERGEDEFSTLRRELREELGIGIKKEYLQEFGTFYAQAAGNEDKRLKMDIFIVNYWDGEIKPDGEIEEIHWIDSGMAKNMEIGSIFAGDVIPRLKKEKLIN
ncbi:MAG: NUDIX domain-containing protein [Parcubacteria group bacterium]|jgi:8-oxo-dGTP pyrophosphatase MutT (NUDIX family)